MPHPDAHTITIVAVFAIVYLGMILGALPFLQLDRTGIALLGAIALVGSEAVGLEEAWAAIHAPTLILLFAFMVVSAQLRLGGFYTWVTLRIGKQRVSPALLLGTLIFVVAGLSAVFSNDVICLAMAPVLVDVCLARRLNPVPFLLALACSANVGSALTLIGNPQNMLIGETLKLDFFGYIRESAVPVVLGLLVTWGIITAGARGRWYFRSWEIAEAVPELHPDARPELDRWQTAKGLGVAAVVFAMFLGAPLPREVVALTAAGVLLLSRKLHSRKMLGLVDWQLLVLFIGLFIVNHAVQKTGLPNDAVEALRTAGIHLDQPAPLFVTAFALSNIVSNVPAVMLLLPLATHEMAGALLALASTLAGNLLIVGSIANIIVVDAAHRRNIVIDWKRHAMVGVPVTLATLTIAALWFFMRTI
ncbi:MAG TPA: anion transporter [Burkholderiales bacterium]|jgi:Na+/H+ antiporter NhaD/arsenite permease-like protein|nr:anion transporter [Burkholderiales bacterium]